MIKVITKERLDEININQVKIKNKEKEKVDIKIIEINRWERTYIFVEIKF